MTAARMAIAAFVHRPHGFAPRPFAQFAQRCRLLLSRFADPYRPEKHYMRGPGPKCRAKQARG